jgi:DNA-binding SARP family transcriptional activator/predicted ATPase
MARVRFGILGPLDVEVDGRPVELGTPKQRALLAMLLIARGQVVSLDRLMDQLWGGEPPPRATASLQAYLSNLRRILEPHRSPRAPATVLVTAPPGYALRLDGAVLDAAVFEAHLAEGERLLAERRPREAGQRFADALALWRGPALANFVFDAFAQEEIVRLEELRLVAIERRLEADVDLGATREAVAELESLVRTHPLRESLWRLLMLGLYRSGRQADALHAFQTARDALVRELGLEPGPDLRRLEADILAQAPSLDAPLTSRETVPQPRGREPEAAGNAEPARAYFGRDEELARLRTAWDFARTGDGRIVLVSGDAGIGKTRLVHELIADAAPDMVVACGGGYEGGLAPPFWAWVQVLRTVLANSSAERFGAVADPLRAELAQLLPELGPETATAEPNAQPEATRFRMYDAVSTFLFGVARRQPLLIVLDDLHWVDSASLELLNYVATTVSAAPALLIGTYRPEEVSPVGALAQSLAALARVGVAERIRLSGLQVADVGEFIRQTTGTQPSEDAVRIVHRRTDGNPFFVGELVRLLASERLLGTSSESQLHLIPEGVRDVIRRRMGRLPEQTNAVLTLAAVIGTEFDLSIIEDAASLDADAAFDILESAVVSGMLVGDADVPGRFRFSHALVQETIYEELTPLRRTRLHARVAHALERTGAGEDSKRLADLAHHFLQAAPAGEAHHAVKYATLAARAALASLGYESAQAHLNRAQQVLESLPAEPGNDRLALDVQLLLMQVLSITQGYSSDAMSQVCRRAQLLSLRLGNVSELVQLLWAQWGIHIGLAQFAAADQVANQMLDVGRTDDDQEALLGGLQALGAGAVHQGRILDGRALLREAITVADRLADPSLAERFFQHPSVFARSFLALAQWLLGEDHAAGSLSREAVSIARTLAHPFTLTLSLFFDAWLAVFRRDVATAREQAEVSQAMAAKHQFTMLESMATIFAAWARAHGGSPAVADHEIEQGLRALERARTRMVRPLFLALHAEVHMLTGQREAALARVEQGLAEIAELGERFYEAELHRLRGKLLESVAVEQATVEFDHAVTVARMQGAHPLEDRARASLSAL